MGHDLFVLAYVTCVGFVIAGLIASLYQLISSKPVGFSVSVENWTSAFGAMFMVALAGPVILMRNALRGRRIEKRPIGWLFGSAAIAGMWSAVSGILELSLIIGAMNALS